MSKRKKPAASPPIDTVSAAHTEAAAPWMQRFQLLDSCFCFLTAKKAIPSLNTVVSLAAHLSGNAAILTTTHVRQMVSIGVVKLDAQPRGKVVQQDEFNPTPADPHETIELVQFPDTPHPSKRASTKRMLLFQRALQTTAFDLTAVPEFEAPAAAKRAKVSDVLSAADASLHNIPYLKALTQASYYDGQVVHVETIPSRRARFGHRQLEDLGVCEAVRRAVTVDKLYSHQSDAIAAILDGQHVVISTSTSSGKSMVYNVPVAHAMVTSNATSFFLFPTKALAQDQVQSFRTFLGRCDGLDPSMCATYDGDTAMSARSGVRSSARVFFTNPDMLHVSILPQHKAWSSVLSRLKYIVVDEAHMYRGIFGSHVANVLRRVFRLCYLYGSHPQVVCCSASIQNPREHFAWLVPQESLRPTNQDATVVERFSRGVAVLEPDQDGSPCGAKHFVVWRPNPPPPTSLDPDKDNQDMTGSTIFQAAQILATLVAAKVHTIAFCRGRKLTELVLDYTHGILRSQKMTHLVSRVKGYRGGYSIESRRAIETQLFRQELLGVVATNALELGIDIGSLECTLHLGYPPSIASMWQQAGRAGRSGKDSIAVIVCFDSPLDVYNTSLGSAMFHKSPEAVVLDPNNPHVVEQHLQCASLELDLLSQRCGTDAIDRVVFPCDVDAVVAAMVGKGDLMTSGDGFRLPTSVSVKDITIRNIAQDNYNVVDMHDDHNVIDTIPGHRVFFQVYPSAAYLHQGREYVITKVDTAAKIVLAKPCSTRLKYYTTCRDFTDVDVTTTFMPSVEYSSHVHLGIAHSTTFVVGCYALEKRTRRILHRTDFSLPPMESDGHAVWMDIPFDVAHQCPDAARSGDERNPTRDALHGVNHLILAVIPHFMLVDSNDLATEHVSPLEKRIRPFRVIVYETCQGGIGIVQRVATLFPQIVACAKSILDQCDCVEGCPRCVHSPNCSEMNNAVSKPGAIAVLAYMAAQLGCP